MDFVIASATSAKSPEALLSRLNSLGLPNTSTAQAFASEVYAQVPHKTKTKSSKDASNKAGDKQAQPLVTQQYGLLLDDVNSGVTENKPSKKSKEKGKAKEESSARKERHTRKRDTDGREWESDEEEKATKRRRAEEDYRRASTSRSPPPRNRSRSPSRPADGDRDGDGEDIDLPTAEDEEAARDRDRRERDAFSERMKGKDREKTKKVVEDRSSSRRSAAASAADELRRLGDDSAARVLALPGIREHSRQSYLAKREIQQIELLKKEIQDEEALFRGMKVSKRELRDLDYKKEVLRLAQSRMGLGDKYEGYQLPDDYFTEQGKLDKKKKESTLYARYDEQRDGANFTTDVDQWEQSQTKHSTLKMGALDKPEIIQGEEYDYVFDESQTIAFVMDQTIEGITPLSAKDALLKQQIEEAENRGTQLQFI